MEYELYNGYIMGPGVGEHQGRVAVYRNVEMLKGSLPMFTSPSVFEAKSFVDRRTDSGDWGTGEATQADVDELNQSGGQGPAYDFKGFIGKGEKGPYMYTVGLDTMHHDEMYYVFVFGWDGREAKVIDFDGGRTVTMARAIEENFKRSYPRAVIRIMRLSWLE